MRPPIQGERAGRTEGGVTENVQKAKAMAISAPADSAELVAIAIPDGVEAGARADFETPERQTRLLGDLQKTSDQDARSTHFIRLRR